MPYKLTYSTFGAQAILINWPQEINPQIREDIYHFDAKIQQGLSDSIVETVVAYASLTVFIHPNVKKKVFISKLKGLYNSPLKTQKKERTTWHIPVCYDPSLGLDLVTFAKAKEIHISEVISLHTQPSYEVCFLGFLPGFLYLAGLDSRLKMPRLEKPRAVVPKGSVAIGGEQTGVYPVESPGGWHILGRTPVDFFDLKKSPPSFLKAGDYMKFEAISLEEYQGLSSVGKGENQN